MPTCPPNHTIKQEAPARRGNGDVSKVGAFAAALLARFNRRFGEIHASTLAVSDALMIFLGFMLGYWLRFHSGLFPPAESIPSAAERFALIPWLVFIWIFACPAFEIYLYRSGFTWTHLFIKIMGAVLLATGVSLALNQLSGVKHSRLVIVFGWTFSLILIGIARYLINLLVSTARSHGIGVVKVAVVGTERPAYDVITMMQANPKLGYTVAGVVPDGEPADGRLAELNVRSLGTLDNIREIVRRNAIGQLIIALPHSERKKILEILAEFETDDVSVRIVSSVIDRLARPIEVGEIGDIRLLALRDHPLTGWTGTAKRAIDFIVSLVALILLAPLFAAIAIATKLTSPGPVFYRQERVGRDDRPFVMYKFRSMRVGAEEETGPVWAREGDQRRTRVGAFLRKTSLDELPQLYNILLGQMSLVGPRPERPEFVAEFKKQIPKYLRRHKVKAGLTGWAQANGWRGNTPVEKRIECDLWYITNWSLSLDLEIVLKTIVEIFRARNAY